MYVDICGIELAILIIDFMWSTFNYFHIYTDLNNFVRICNEIYDTYLAPHIQITIYIAL